jgi:hypothetical protein
MNALSFPGTVTFPFGGIEPGRVSALNSTGSSQRDSLMTTFKSDPFGDGIGPVKYND